MRVLKFVQGVMVASIVGVLGGHAMAGEPNPTKKETVVVTKGVGLGKDAKLVKTTKLGKQLSKKKPVVVAPLGTPDPRPNAKP